MQIWQQRVQLLLMLSVGFCFGKTAQIIWCDQGFEPAALQLETARGVL